jgi:Gpi18-like mannosyltransferase
MLPVLERGLAAIVHNPFVAGLIISNLACLGLFMVLYRLVSEDFDESAAGRTVLYMAVFPAAFFLAAAYNESLFLLFSVSSFRYMRRGRWWLAGLAAVGAGLTRSIGVCLVIPFLYEYMHQRGWQARAIRRDIVALLGIFAGPAVMMVYGAVTYHDYLAFAHAQRFWKRHLSPPWTVFSDAYHILAHNGALTFVTIHSAIDLGAVLFALVLLVATFAGPLKLRRDQWSYGFYAATLYLAVILVPEGGTYPLSSLSRFILEIFPLFVVLAHRDRQGSIGIYYVTISGSLLAFMLLQWLSGGWIV